MTEAIENPLLAVEELIKITTSLSTERDLHQLLNMILTSARKLTHADAGMIYLLDSTKRNLFVDIFQCNSLDSKGKSLSVVPLYAGDVRNSSNVISYCAFSGKTINIPDVYKYSGFDFSDIYQRDKMTGYKTKSVVAIPLTDHEEITVGILLLVNIADPITGQIVPLPEELSQLVGAFASQAAVAIDNVQLIENNQRLIEILNHTNRELAEENRKLREKIVSQYDFSRIIGHGEKMKKIFALMEKVFNSVATVLIRGETGTGKELIAQTIHYNSPRRKGEFVAQNCAALPENLLESELFGYKKGAFSGAATDKKGLIEIADDGTLFLDEIGDIPLPLQAKLLRVLQEKEVRPLGATTSKKVDVRVLAATHQDLPEKIKQGEFREDLYYRLCVFPIDVPPLRERKDDLPALLQHFLENFAKSYGKEVAGFSPKAFDLLLQYDYPGNIRELKNIIERAVLLLETGGSVLPEHLPAELQVETENNVVQNMLASVKKSGRLRDLMESYEARLIKETLAACQWNQTKTAVELKIARRTLVEKINKYGIQRKA